MRRRDYLFRLSLPRGTILWWRLHERWVVWRWLRKAEREMNEHYTRRSLFRMAFGDNPGTTVYPVQWGGSIRDEIAWGEISKLINEDHPAPG